jgi:hypothetical protein
MKLAVLLSPLLLAGNALAQEGSLTLNARDYFEQRGLNVLVFSSEYNGMFFAEKKVAVIELDPNDTPLETASVFQVTAEGATVERPKGKVQPWGQYLRYSYASFDFSSIQDPAREAFRTAADPGRRFEELIWPALDRAVGFSISAAVEALPHLGPAYADRLRPYARKYKDQMDGLEKQNPYGVPIGTRGWAGNAEVIGWAVTNYHLHQAYPDLVGPEYALRGLHYVLGRHPSSNVSFVSGVGTRSKKVAYGNNRADFTFIAGGVVPGVLVLKPDFPENKEDWPFLWGENEYVIDICAHYILLANMANDLLGRHP